MIMELIQNELRNNSNAIEVYTNLIPKNTTNSTAVSGLIKGSDGEMFRDCDRVTYVSDFLLVVVTTDKSDEQFIQGVAQEFKDIIIDNVPFKRDTRTKINTTSDVYDAFYGFDKNTNQKRYNITFKCEYEVLNAS